jgi:hypothetical protein
VVSLKVHEPTRTLLAGTYGRSAYKISLDDIQVGVSEPVTTAPLLELSPNPFNPALNAEMHIQYNVPTAGVTELYITDIQGNRVKVLRNSRALTGAYSAIWNGTLQNGNPAPDGIYFCTLKTATGSIHKKFILISGSL